MSSSPPYESPPSSQEEVQPPPSSPAEEADTAKKKAPRRIPFWNPLFETTYDTVPQPVRPWWTGWTAYEDTAIEAGFVRGIKPINTVQTHLPLRPLMTDVDPRKCFSRDDLGRRAKYTYSRRVPVILSKLQKRTLSDWFSGTRQIYNHAVDSLNKRNMPPDITMLGKAFSTERTEEEVAEITRKRLAAQGLYNGARKTTRKGAGQRTSVNPDMLTGQQWDEALEEEEKEDENKNVHQPLFPNVDPQFPSGHLLGRFPKLKELPAAVRQDAVRDAYHAVKSMEARFRKGYKAGKLHFRNSQNNNSATLGTSSIRSHEYLAPDPHKKRNGTIQKKVYTTIQIGHDFGEVTVRQKLPEEVFEHAISFSRCKRGRYYLHFNLHKSKEQLPEPGRPAEREVIGLDPGVRSFVTRYDANSGAHYEYSAEKIFVLADKARSLVRRVSELRKKLKQENGAAGVSLRIKTPVLDLGTHEGKERINQYNYRDAEKEVIKRRRAAMAAIRKVNGEKLKALERVSNFRSNFHKQVAAHLCAEKGRTILLPEFRVSQMVAKQHPETGAKRKLRQVTARNMQTLAHYKFRSYMKHKALMSGCELIIVTEDYTTMTCGGCGHLNRFVGGKKVFKCNSAACYIKEHANAFDYLERCGREKDAHVQNCQYENGRDENAARNVILKQIKKPLPEEFLAARAVGRCGAAPAPAP